MRSFSKFAVLLLCVSLAVPGLVLAQSDVGTVTGTVTEATGAVVSQATVTLKDVATNIETTTKTNSFGQYMFPRVSPGTYTLTVSATGFATTVTRLAVSVGKTAQANLTLKVGRVTETVEVAATAGNELQTLDASVGNVLNVNQLANMPNLNRDATTLILYQPGAAPVQSPTADEHTGSQIAGARSDQNTFMIDGGDATSNTDANSAYTNNFYATPRAAIPTPVESLEEFRVVTNNNTGGFSRSAGAEVQMITRRGTNAWHGALYYYGVQDETNANSWENKHTTPLTPNPEWRDGRFGARLGGPIIKDKTFFFIHWESRHFLQGTALRNGYRWAPTQSVRSGLLGYLDTTGAQKFINPATQDCAGNPATPPNTCDPRGMGLNPTILAIWNQMPLPNTTSGGDGVNFLNYVSPATVFTNEEFGVARIDHQISQNWHAMASYRYGVTDQSTTNQVRISPTASPQSMSFRPMQPRYAVFGLTGQLTPNVTNDLHLDYLRHWWQWGSQAAVPQVSGLGGAVQIANESVSNGVVPVNIDTQQARQRNWNGKDLNLIDNVSWVKGKHLVQFGGHYGWQRLVHTRDDIVTYAMTSPVYYSLWNTAHSAIDIPVPADAKSASAFRTAYASMMGLIEEANQVRTRNGSLDLNPAGTRLNNHTAMNNWELHFVDTWRVAPSLSVTYGLGWSVQMPPFEQNGLQTMMVYADTNKPFTMADYLGTKEKMALQGQAFNPVIGFTPIKDLHRKYPFDPDYSNLSPRLALAWNPGMKPEGFLGRIFGDKKTVVRAGWTRVFDRLTGVDLVMTPALGVGFGQTASCKGPLAAGGCGGATALNGFRIGIDGNSVAIPDPPPVTAPITPGIGGYPFVTRDYHIDPGRKVGWADVFDLSIQRELPSNMLLEVGFIGRRAHDLYQKIDTDQVPYMYTMGGQSFAQAYDATQAAIMAGQAPAVQPFWEAALGGTSSTYCAGFSSCTAAVVANEQGNFAIRDVFDVFSDLDTSWVSGSFLPSTTQYAGSDVTASRGRSSYAGMFVSLRKGTGRGVFFDMNYTLSKAMDSFGWNQDIIDTMMDAYFPDRSYGVSQFDRRHVFNATATWELPFGRGRKFAASSGVLDKLLGGWSTSYIFSASSGLPNQIWNGDSCLEFGDGSQYNDCASMVAAKPVSFNMSRHDSGVSIGPNGYGSSSGAGTYNGGYPNAFSNPDAVAAAFRLPFFSDQRVGFYNGLRGQGRWNLDFAVGKTTRITERLSTRFEVQLINAFNHTMLTDGTGPAAGDTLDISNPSNFGVLTTQYNRPRFIQWGLRFDF